MKKLLLLLLPIVVFAAFTITEKSIIQGTVKDEKGQPVKATVTAGASVATCTAAGAFSISVAANTAFLTVSAPGFAPAKTRLNGQTFVNVILKHGLATADSSMQEVVVTGYSTKKDKSWPGIVSSRINGIAMTAPAPAKSFKTEYDAEPNTEEYSNIVENGFKKVTDHPLSTFSIDVDAASYSNVRRYLNNNQLPPAGAVRTEEMINYFTYRYPQPIGNDPFSINTELANCPWNSDNKLLLIGLQGKTIPVKNLPPSNLVFLIDVSGSMMDENKLPLVKASLKMLVDQLREDDKISIVVYAGNAGLVLPPVSGSNKVKIKTAIDELEAGGSTAGGAGIQLAYQTASQNFMEQGNNRVILCTDGDFNVGESSDDAMVRLIEKERDKGIYLTVLGYGMGNYKDSKMEQLADKGNGNHAYIDGLNEAKKVLVHEFGGTLFTIAKDVKLQVEFNPAKVAGYRLIGYENRLLAKEDFNDDKKDAGELGSGHCVTALYEIIPAGVSSAFLKQTDLLKYQPASKQTAPSASEDWCTIKFRYKTPGNETSKLIVHPVTEAISGSITATTNFRFATAVAGFAMLLRSSEFKGNLTYGDVLDISKNPGADDAEGYRKEFVELVKKAESLSKATGIK